MNNENQPEKPKFGNLTPYEAARAVAYRYVGYAVRTRAELQRRLEREDFSPEIVARVVEEYEATGRVDDAALARAWVQDRADRKRYGRVRLAQELRRKGVEKEQVEEVLSEVEGVDEVRRALEAARSRFDPDAFARLASDARQTEKRRLSQFLQRRGFGWDIITQVLRQYAANTE